MLSLLPQPPHAGCALPGRRFRTVAPSHAVWSTSSRRRFQSVQDARSARCIRVRATDVAESTATAEAPAEVAGSAPADDGDLDKKRQRNASVVAKIDDSAVQEGSELDGVVRSVTKFGAFLDVGLPVKEGRKNNALLHVSEMKAEFVGDANDVAKIGDKLKSSLPPVDLEKLAAEDFIDGIIKSTQDFGAFVDIGAERDALLHVSQMPGNRGQLSELKQGDKVRVRVTETSRSGDDSRLRIGLSALQPGEEPKRQPRAGGAPRQVKYQTEDIVVGQEYEGNVRNVTEVGAFVDIGAPRDALLHTTQQKISVTCLSQEEADALRPARGPGGGGGGGGGPKGTERRGQRRDRTPSEPTGISAGEELTTTVVEHLPYGVRLQIREGLKCLLHRNEFATSGKELDPVMDFPMDSEVKVRVLDVDDSRRRVNVTQKSDEDRALDAAFNSGKGMSTADAPEGGGKAKKGKKAQNGGSDGENALASALFSAGIQFPTEKPSPASSNGKAPAPAEEPAPAENLEPDLKEAEAAAAGESAPASTSAPAEAEPEKKLGDTEPIDPAPILDQGDDSAPAAISQNANVLGDKESKPAETPAPAPAAEQASPAAAPQQTETVSVPSSNGASAPEPAPASNGQASKISAAAVQELRKSSGAGMMDCKKALTESGGDVEKASEYLRTKGLAQAGKRAGRIASEGVIASYIHAGNRLGVILEVNCESDFVARGKEFTELVENLSMQAAASFDAKYVSLDDVDPSMRQRETKVQMGAEDLQNKPEKIRPQIVKGRVDKVLNGMTLLETPYVREPSKTVDTYVKEVSAKLGEKISIRRFVRYTLGEGIEKKEENLSEEVQKQQAAMAEKAAEQAKKEAEALPEADMSKGIKVDSQAVKALRASSGAGMMDCKKALVACDNNEEQAADWLRKKGLAQAGKKAGRATSEGALWSYIHNGERLGVMVEVNCETDFVAKNDKFLELCEDLSMQIAACDATVVSVDDVPKEVLDKEREIELQKEDLQSKPEAIREKIVQGRVDKIAKQQALLECAFVRDTNKTVQQYIKEAIAALGENIQVRRFVRYNLGEGLEKKSQDFAAEVAAQTQGAA
ncbi:hypothetical protein WJX73_005435 [Symbiochloris irregularis]|uniref:Elongation factor Ts, mitochondrial n=1 Tax=Symbiochloris irregularis TaxID=706552 RepID=A0AAW1P7F1_9CHLO